MYEEKATDFRTSLLKLKNSNARAVFCLAHSQQFGLILKQAKELNLDKQWFGTFSAEGPTLINTAEETANGLIYSHFFDAGNPSNNFERIYLEEYQNEYGRQSEAFAALAYDNVRILAEAMKHCKNPEDTECVKNELYKIKDFQGATGLTSIDQNGDTTKQAILKTVKNQEFVLISN
jgi:branched-chain amino acid transport system substrate-binding protein